MDSYSQKHLHGCCHSDLLTQLFTVWGSSFRADHYYSLISSTYRETCSSSWIQNELKWRILWILSWNFPTTANEYMHELISKALMMTENYLVTFDLLWHEICARFVLLFVFLSSSLSLFTQHAPHLCLYPSFSYLFTPAIMIFIFLLCLSLSLPQGLSSAWIRHCYPETSHLAAGQQ